MGRYRLFDLAVVGLLTLTAGCGGTDDSSVRLCDGQPGVRLAVRVGGGGPAPAGQAMLGENGWQFLLVDGSCKAWILASHNEPLRTMTLSPVQEQRLLTALRPSRWSQFDGQPQEGCPDAPGISYRFDQHRISGPACGLSAGAPFGQLNDAFNTQLAALAASAPIFSGDIRYLVIQDPGTGTTFGRTPVPWPLDIPVAAVARPQDQGIQYIPGDSRQATGPDATRLRAIRTTALSGGAGNGMEFNFTPVAADGISYQLFARDAVPLENANGLLPSDLF
jgi:hypothetical protein